MARELTSSALRWLTVLQATVDTWKMWDDINFILNHRIVSGHLWALLIGSDDGPLHGHKTASEMQRSSPRPHICGKGDTLKKILALDMIGILAQVAVMLDDRDLRKLLLKRRGQEAQSLLNLLQVVCDSLCASDDSDNHS